ncbi:monofunctional biosynthetic peptidoglycan transglycosylase [Thermodesulfobacteriota bacterium]
MKLPRSKSKKKSFPRRFLGWFLKLSARLIFILLLLSIVQVFVLRYINPPFTLTTAVSWIQQKITFSKYKGPDYQWKELKNISPWLVQAVLAGEDQRFGSHNGFDFIELNKAVKDILESGRVRGASTITMQVARTVFLWPERNWLRKALEAYYTVLIELFWTKSRIIVMYLNTVDWGSGIMGAEAASQKYFQVSALDVNQNQAALMAAILPSPHRWSPVKPNKQVVERKKRILRDMRKMHL